ncbi:MAG: hypothetical protein MUC59_18570 [Saprospiraceae bacterium]|jgi:benzoyl-CoA reductase/2-hydroxyglutaryl-CoA dehydratase subunit BcrC/BadD/HgdB|nr:hypothetical protein [Saprospiraceae bacterium]
MVNTKATPKLKSRDFESYFLEYQLLSTEVEINAYWKRMDEVVVNMTEEEKASFFKQLDEGLTKDVQESKKMRHELAAGLPNTKANEKLRQLLLK